MSGELPLAPVNAIIRRNAGKLRVSEAATEELARRIQAHGTGLAVVAAERATAAGRKTLMSEDFDAEPPDPEALELPIAPVDRIARLEIDDRYRVSQEARVTLACLLEEFADDVAAGAAHLTRHAGRRTVQAEDIALYFALEPYYEES